MEGIPGQGGIIPGTGCGVSVSNCRRIRGSGTCQMRSDGGNKQARKIEVFFVRQVRDDEDGVLAGDCAGDPQIARSGTPRNFSDSLPCAPLSGWRDKQRHDATALTKNDVRKPSAVKHACMRLDQLEL